jgi:predicted PurR-regulated permease PerM
MIDEKILDVSWKTILKIAIAVICFYVLYSVRDIIVWFVFSLVISILFNPIIDFLQKNRIPRVVSVLSVYFVLFGLLSVLIWMVVPIFVEETQLFLQSFPEYFEKISPPLRGFGIQAFESIESFISSIGDTLESKASNIFSILFSLFGGIFSTTFVIVTSIFLSLEEKVIEKAISLIFPKRYESIALSIWERSQKKVAGWFGARLIACLFVGLASYLVFFIFKVKYPFILGLFAGVFNFIPFIGPLITGVVLFLIIFPQEMLKAIFVIISFTLVQTIEGNILSPILMKKIVAVPPALVIVALVVGGKLWGVLGSLFVIPLTGILFEFVKEFLEKRRDKEVVVIK